MKHIKQLNEGYWTFADSNADFLNKTFGTHYSGWLKSVYPAAMDADPFVWMVHFDEKVRNGWKNKIIDDETILEYNVDYSQVKDGNFVNSTLLNKRMAVSITDGKYGRKYEYLGVYEYDAKNSNPMGCRYYKKVK